MSPLTLFYPEHEKAVRTFYEGERESYTNLLRSLARVFESEVLPKSAEFDARAGGITVSRRVLFEQGVARMPFGPPAGLSLPFGMYCLAMELAGSADAPTAMSLGIHDTVAEGLYRFGSEAQKGELLEELVSGKKLASFSLTEPSSGSDARSMRTKATKEGSRYIINGTKTFITNAGEADVYFVLAATAGGHSAFLVDRANPGLSAGPDIPKLGMRGSRTAEVRLENCVVAADALVGKEGEAFQYVKAMLNGSRIVMGSICVGIALAAYTKALRYSTERELFSTTLSEMQLTKEKIADMRSQINASRLACLYAARLKDLGEDYASEAAQAKVLATEAATKVCDQTVQIFGGYGYTNADVHRHWRDARLLTIGEGASEVLRLLVADKELGSVA